MSEINLALIGSGFMGKTHSLGYRAMPIFFPEKARVRLRVVADVTADLARSAAERFGFEEWVAGWDRVFDYDIDAVDIVTPNDLHEEIALEAARRGKHILCEKPLAPNAAKALRMAEAVEAAGVVNMSGFNYRHAPAVAMTKKMIDEGAVGEIYHFRATYLQDFCADPRFPFAWRFDAARAGSGALGDTASHAIDLARYLVGEFDQVTALTRSIVKERPLPDGTAMREVTVDDAVNMMIRFKTGATGSLEASRFCWGHKNHLTYEINGSKGSLGFDWERSSELLYYSAHDPKDRQGFRDIKMGPMHPNAGSFAPVPAMGMAYAETAILQASEFVSAIAEGRQTMPNFREGARVAQIVDGVLESARSGRWVRV